MVLKVRFTAVISQWTWSGLQYYTKLIWANWAFSSHLLVVFISGWVGGLFLFLYSYQSLNLNPDQQVFTYWVWHVSTGHRDRASTPPGSLCISVIRVAMASPPDMVSLLIGLMTWSAEHKLNLGLNAECLSQEGDSPQCILCLVDHLTPTQWVYPVPWHKDLSMSSAVEFILAAHTVVKTKWDMECIWTCNKYNQPWNNGSWFKSVAVFERADERCIILEEKLSCFQPFKQPVIDRVKCGRKEFLFDFLPAFFGLLCCSGPHPNLK